MLDAAFPVLNRHTFRRAMSQLASPASWPTRANRRAARARRALYFPFGGGPRACIGSHFATLEAIITVALLLQRFEIRSHNEDVPLDTEGTTLRPKGAVPIQLAAR